MTVFSRKIWGLFAAFMLLGFHSVDAQRNSRNKEENNDWKAEYFFTEGEKYFILEDYAKSLESFQKAYDFDSENPAINYKLAQIYSKSDQIDKALLYINKSLEKTKDNKYYYLLASDLQTRNGNISSAAELYREMIETIPQTDEYLYELAALYLYNDNTEEALKTYDQIESKLGVSEESSFQKVNIYLSQGNVDSAIEEVKKLMEAFPNNPGHGVKLGEILISNGRFEEAISHLEKVVIDYPYYTRARLMLSDVYERTGENEKSRQNLLVAFEDPGLDPTSKLQILNTYRTSQNVNRTFVMDLAETIAESHPKNATVKMVLGDIYLDYNRNEKALEYYLEAVQIDPSVFNVWDNIMKLEYGANRMEALVTYSETAMELFPNQYSPFFFNGLANVRLQKFKEAVFALNETKKRTKDPNIITQCNLVLGDAHNQLKEYKKSDEYFETILVTDPDNNFALNNYSYYLSLRKENLTRAKELSARLVANNPNNSTYLDTYAWVLFQMEEYEEAKEIIERAVKNSNANAVHYEHYGDILFMLGEVDAAVEQWRQAKSLNSRSKLIDKKIADRKLYN